MHELSIAQNLIEIIKETSTKKNFFKVSKIGLRIGAMAGVDKEALSFCIEVASRGTCVDGAKIDFEDSPLTGQCKGCDHIFNVKDFIFKCPRCEGIDIQVMSGREIRVSYLDVEDGAKPCTR